MSATEDEATTQFMDSLVSEEMKQEMRLIWECVNGGFQDYNDPTLYNPAAKRDHTASVRAAIRNAHIVARAKRAAVASPETIQIVTKRGRTTFRFMGRTEVWFKKLNRYGEPSYRPSQQSLEFTLPPVAQRTLPMEQPPEVKRVIAGYRLDSTATNFTVVISRPIGHGLYATVELKAHEVIQLFLEPAPAAAVGETIGQVRRRVKIRREAQGQSDAQVRNDADQSVS